MFPYFIFYLNAGDSDSQHVDSLNVLFGRHIRPRVQTGGSDAALGLLLRLSGFRRFDLARRHLLLTTAAAAAFVCTTAVEHNLTLSKA